MKSRMKSRVIILGNGSATVLPIRSNGHSGILFVPGGQAFAPQEEAIAYFPGPEDTAVMFADKAQAELFIRRVRQSIGDTPAVYRVEYEDGTVEFTEHPLPEVYEDGKTFTVTPCYAN